MKFITDFADTFMSPQDGTLLLSSFPSLEKNYTFLGNNSNQAFASPILIDIRLELIRLKSLLGTTAFILQQPIPEFYNSQALDQLGNGFLVTTEGILSIGTPGPGTIALPQGMVFVGDSNNLAAAQQIITIDNLPNLGVAVIEGLPLPAGKIWRGTASNRPEESNAVSILEADVLAINARFLTAAWILRKAPIETLWPTAQFINHLPENRILNHTTDGTIGVASLTHNYLWVGDENNIPVESDKIPSGGLPDLSTGRFWMGDGNNRPQDTGLLHKNLIIGTEDDQLGFREKIYDDNLPDLTTGRFWMGDGNNRPQDTGLSYKNIIIGTSDDQLGFRETLYIDNLPDLGVNPLLLGKGKIWRGTISSRPVESDDLSTLEISVDFLKFVTIPAIEAEIAGIQGQLLIIEGEITGLTVAVGVLQGQIVVIQGQIIAVNTRIDNLRLNTIPADGDVSFYGYKLTNLADPVNPTDGVNLRSLSGAIGNITLDGFVLGDSDENGLIHTTRGPLCLLTNIPAGGDVSLGDFRITNLGDYEADKDALSIEGFWDLIHNPDLYVARINPELAIIGPTQNFSFNQNLAQFQLDNTFLPIAGIPSQTFFELRNKDLSGFRIKQLTSQGDTHGTFVLEYFLNAQLTGTPILTFGNDNTFTSYFNISSPDPTLNPHLTTKYYVDTAIATAIGGLNITLDGFVLGGPAVNGVLHTTIGPDCLLTIIPAGGNVSLDHYRITNLGDFEADNDALSLQGFWNLIHHPDLFVARVNPEVDVLGTVQQFSFNQNRSVFQIENTFTPTNLIPSKNIEEFRNKNSSGYRMTQETSSTSNSGDFYLEKFLNGEEDGEKILSFNESSDELTLEKVLNANNQRIVNVTEEPAADQDAISFIYLWRVLNDEVF